MLQHYDRVLALQSAVRPPRGASDRQPREGGLSIQTYCPKSNNSANGLLKASPQPAICRVTAAECL